MTVRAIARDIIDAGRVTFRDVKSYCAIIFDDNNIKPLARMHFYRKQWYLGVFDGEKKDRVAISILNDIYKLADQIRSTAERYRAE
jgi:hypothetical protein